MDLQAFSAVFCEIFAKNGLQRFLNEQIIAKFYQLTDILLESNKKFNLTAIREVPDVIAKHYADCLLAEALFPEGSTVLDLGCGGGFPTFPLAIVRPDLQITALDSTQKKIDFVAQTTKTLGLLNVSAVCARAEDVANGKFRESFDAATSRAMARMNVLAEMALPCTKLGGKMVILKGARGKEEAAEAENAIQKLGGVLINDLFSELLCPNGEKECRHLLVVEKKNKTPAGYPRAYATILKKPL